MLPEAMDLAEIDKLTGVPKPKGKLIQLNNSFFCRLTAFCGTDASALHHREYFQVQSQGATRHTQTWQGPKANKGSVCCVGWEDIPIGAAVLEGDK